MRNLKKVLSLVLCMAMMLSVMVVGAGAAFKDQSKIVNEEAVDMCSALNIINGYTDGSFKPEGNITRAEACKMICVALNGGKEPVLGTNATATFTDIKGHWAEGYIEYCVSEGIVAGIGGGKFNPNGNVTGSQFAKMLLIALGYRADHEKFVGSAWEVNVNVKATQKGLYEDLATMDPSVALTRDNAAQMVWNALQAKEVKYEYTLVSENGQLVSKVNVADKGITLMADKYGVIDDESAIMTGFSYDEDKDEWTYYFDREVIGAERDNFIADYNISFASFTSDVDYTDLFRQNVKVVYTVKNSKVDTVYGMFAYESSVIAEGVLGDIDAADLDDKSIEIADVDYDTTGKTVASYAFNGAADSSAIDKTYKAPAFALGYSMKAIDNTGDDKIDEVVYVPFSVAEVTYLGATTITTKNVATSATNNVKIEKINLADGIAEDDYVMIVDKANTVDGVAAYTELNVLSGKVAATKGSDVKVDGTWYTLANGQSMTLDTEYDFVVVGGYVYFAKATSSEVDVADYALVTAFQANKDWDADYPKASLLTSTGEIITVEYKMAANGGSIEKNALVYIDDIDDGVYVLTTKIPAITDGDAKGDLLYNKDTGKAGTYPIADDAVIYVVDTTETPNTYKVISGAELKKADSDTLNNVMVQKNDDTGFTSVVFATMDSSLATSDDTAYGYVTADPVAVKDADKNTVYEITMGDTTLTTKKGVSIDGIGKGSVISYKLTDGKISTLVEVGDLNNAKTGACSIVAYDGKLLQVNESADTYEVTKDTVIIYINAADSKIAEGGKISLAQKASDGKYIANEIGLAEDKANDDGNYELKLLVVDVNNNIYDVEVK